MEELLLMVLLQIAVQNKSAVDINVALMCITGKWEAVARDSRLMSSITFVLAGTRS